MLANLSPKTRSTLRGFAFLECALSLTIVISVMIGLTSLGDFLHSKWIVSSLCSDAARTLSQPLNSMTINLNSQAPAGSSLTFRAANTVALLEQTLRQRYLGSIQVSDYRFEILLLDNPRNLLAAGGALQLPPAQVDSRAVTTLKELGQSGLVLVRLGVLPRTSLSRLLGETKNGYYDERLVVVRSDLSI